jgi:sugar porter (SP) family MFS transporter
MARYAFLIASVAALGGFLFGYDLVIISGAQIFLRAQFHLSDAQFAFTTTSAIIGCIFGPSLGGAACDRLGRERTMVLSAVLVGVSAVMTALARDITTFNGFRVVGGLGVGICSIAAPMYIAEVAPARSRGGKGVLYQLAILVGCMISAIVAWLLAKYLPETVCWRWMFGSQMVPVLAFIGLALVIPRSPRWLAENGRGGEALNVLRKLNPEEQAREEMDEIAASLDQESGTWAELLDPKMRIALLAGLCLAIFNNWTGWSAMGYYIPTLFQMAGVAKASDAIFQFIIVSGWASLLTLLAVFLVDKFGRRPLWIAGSGMMIVALTAMGLVFQYNLTGFPVMLAMLFCAAPHAFALGPLPWLMMSELYPTRIRARAVAITTTTLWVTGWSGPMIFPILMGYFERRTGSIGPAFWLFAGICAIALWFGLKILPETKGKTLERIAQGWAGSGN